MLTVADPLSLIYYVNYYAKMVLTLDYFMYMVQMQKT